MHIDHRFAMFHLRTCGRILQEGALLQLDHTIMVEVMAFQI